ncbi:MAG: hypothetical protein HY074_10145 [Deltaproteobacteria bacterium]|nr:hypothetical protein [Deltaproteobacteria bacterium]
MKFWYLSAILLLLSGLGTGHARAENDLPLIRIEGELHCKAVSGCRLSVHPETFEAAEIKLGQPGSNLPYSSVAYDNALVTLTGWWKAPKPGYDYELDGPATEFIVVGIGFAIPKIHD